MKTRIIFIVRYFAFWLCLFLLAKLMFLLYEHNQSFQISFVTWLKIFIHGFKLDLSTAGYFTLFPSLVLLFTSFFGHRVGYHVINVYSAIMIAIFLLISLVDLEIYKYWGSRLDSAPLRFLSKPAETLASTSLITLIIYFLSFGLFTWLLFLFYRRLIAFPLKTSSGGGIRGFLVFSFITALLFLPIRGGLGVSPINTGSVYFSKTAFANHAAINVIWNFGHSLAEAKESHNPYIFYKNKEYTRQLKDLYLFGDSTKFVLKNNRPNIVLIILESFSAKLIEPLGGAKGITPQFNEMSRHGVLFSQIYSTDSRTDKGLATIISGYPVLEAVPILQFPEKTQHLPFLSADLTRNGYHATFLYGGDVDFANMRSYLVNGHFSTITSGSAFPASERTGKWGVPDQYVYKKFLEDIKADTGRWFKVMLSLSNHEPFEIPVRSKFGKRSLTDRFFSSAFYADSCLGDFIRRFKQTEMWNNTLVILVADHGSRLPEYDEVFEPRKHHIPLLWTGGAVMKDTVVNKTGSQADLAITLLRQLGIKYSGYIFGKDLLAPSSKSFAFYSIKNGIGMLTDSSGFGYDFITGKYSYSYGKIDSSHLQTAKSLQQFIYDHYLNLSHQSR